MRYDPELEKLIESARRQVAAMSPEERGAMHRAQRESYVRAELNWPERGMAEKHSEKSTGESRAGFQSLELSRMAVAEAERSGDAEKIAEAKRLHRHVVIAWENSQRRF